jgi:Integrase core domain.
VIFDSGASIAITGDKKDFVVPLQALPAGLTIGGMARGAKVEGIGLVRWKFKTPTGTMILSVTCYYVLACGARLLSPQRLFNKKKGLVGSFSIEEDHATLMINDNPPCIIEYENTTFLPVGLAWNATQTTKMLHPSANLCVTNEANQNLTPSQKLLMTWHYRFGHCNFPFVQCLLRLPVFAGEKFQSVSRAELPKCEICEYAKAHVQSTAGNRQTPNPATDGALKDGQLRPGNKVSADHFESGLKGRTYSSYGKTTSDQYVGGCIFVDHMSGYVHVEHQLGFSSSETIWAKQNFEQSVLGHGVLIEDYLTDNGIFSKTQFVDHISQHNQQIHYCGVNAHHKNAVAERAIRTVSDLARALLLHASTHWPDGIEASLWPMAVDHAVHLYNTFPNQHGICPLDLFSGTTVPRHKLRDLHVWGCPVYGLDPVLQQGKKLPCWQPRSRSGVFLGYSRYHSSDVPLVLNDSFSTVTSVATDSDPPDFWTAPNIDSCLHRIPLEVGDTSASLLLDDWLTTGELEEKRRHEHRRSRVRPTFVSDVPVPAPLATCGRCCPCSIRSVRSTFHCGCFPCLS